MKKFKVIMDKAEERAPIMLEALCNQFLGWLQVILFFFGSPAKFNRIF